MILLRSAPLLLATLALAAVLAAPAAAPAAEFASLPRITQPVLESLARRCRGAGGALSFEPGVVAPVDISMDAISDYVIDTRFVRCSAAEQPWLADHGREIVVFVSIGPGSWVEGWKGYALDWRVDWEEGRPVLRIETRSVCREAGHHCELTYALRATRLVEVARRSLERGR